MVLNLFASSDFKSLMLLAFLNDAYMSIYKGDNIVCSFRGKEMNYVITLASQHQEALIVFGHNIRMTRERKGFTLNKLAKRANYDRLCLSRLEYGTQNITYRTAINLAKALDVPFPFLFSRNYSLVENDKFLIYTDDDYLLVFIENLKRELAKKNLGQFHIYMESGLSESVASRIINGKEINPTIITLERMASAINAGLFILFQRNTYESEENE